MGMAEIGARMRMLGLASLLALSMVGHATGEEALRFDLTVGHHSNLFFRQGPVSAHLVLGSGRIVVALPAGNSGIGLWTDAAGQDAGMRLIEPLAPVTLHDSKGRPLHGVAGVVEVATEHLTLQQVLLANIRVLRDFQHGGKRVPAVEAAPVVEGSALVWRRDRLDGAAGFRLNLTVLNGTAHVREDGWITLDSADGQALRLHLVAVGGEPPLTPLATSEILNDRAPLDEKARNVLTFLSYREKLMAGSWTYNTYFGRDTLMSLRLLQPVLKPAAQEAGLGAVLDRLNPDGEVAHEEDVGEFAVMRHAAEGRAGESRPILDYKMVDDDFMLAPVMAEYLLSSDHTARDALLFLARRTPAGDAYGTLLLRNLEYVLTRAAAFAADPVPANLIALHQGQVVGEWRDSEEGLAAGRMAYNVNAVFVPAALAAIDRLHRSGLLAAYGAKTAGLDRATAMARVWQDKALGLFTVSIPADRMRDAVRTFAAEQKVDAAPALATLPDGLVTFNALALDVAGTPIPVMHSDDGFAFLFLDPQAADIDRSLAALMRPFPAGLMTDVGMVVANAANATTEIRAEFGSQFYHGAVIWSWQQALMAAGLQRQLRRTDLPAGTRHRLRQAQTRLWKAIHATDGMRTSELWSWSFDKGRYQVRPFGQEAGDQTESNAAQLWSTVFLGIDPHAAH